MLDSENILIFSQYLKNAKVEITSIKTTAKKTATKTAEKVEA